MLANSYFRLRSDPSEPEQSPEASIDIDLHAARVARLGQEFAVREGGSDHEKGVATLHQVPGRLGPQKAQRSGDPR